MTKEYSEKDVCLYALSVGCSSGRNLMPVTTTTPITTVCFMQLISWILLICDTPMNSMQRV